VVRHYNHTLAINNQGSVMAYRQNYLDLDPTYRDRYGRPLLRMTFDFHANEQKQANYIADICVKIGQAMGADRVVRRVPPQRYSIVPYQSTHNTGGAVLGADPRTSALNRFTQSWDVPNIFVTGACAFSQNTGKNPTGPVGALAYWTADAITIREESGAVGAGVTKSRWLPRRRLYRRQTPTTSPGHRAAEQRDELTPFQLIELFQSLPARAALQDIEWAGISQRVSER